MGTERRSPGPFSQLPVQIPIQLRLVETGEGPAIAWDRMWEIGMPINENPEPWGLLSAFANLENASPGEVLKFAQKFGPLILCEHGLPDSHNPFRSTNPPDWKHCELMEPVPVAAYQEYARRVSAAIQIANQLHRAQLGRGRDWNAVHGWSGDLWPPRREPEPPTEAEQTLEVLNNLLGRLIGPGAVLGADERSLEADRSLFAAELDRWAEEANIRLSFSWPVGHDTPVIGLSGDGMWGAVVRELLLYVAQAKDLDTCDHCGKVFATARRRTEKKPRLFCPPCRKKGAPKQHARRDYKHRERRKRSGPGPAE